MAIYVKCWNIHTFRTILAISPFGKFRLGPDQSKPAYSNVSWFAMLFSAGMGIGLMFWSVAEPVMHYVSPPVGTKESIESAKMAMNIVFFHWGITCLVYLCSCWIGTCIFFI
jgi:choline/glycine/proline betaine transport protein